MVYKLCQKKDFNEAVMLTLLLFPILNCDTVCMKSCQLVLYMTIFIFQHIMISFKFTFLLLFVEPIEFLYKIT